MGDNTKTGPRRKGLDDAAFLRSRGWVEVSTRGSKFQNLRWKDPLPTPGKSTLLPLNSALLRQLMRDSKALDAARHEIAFYKDREATIIAALKPADGGQFREDIVTRIDALATDRIVLLYDVELRRPGCALLQAVAGCESGALYLAGFDGADWLTYPTPGMRRIQGTIEEWRRAAAMTPPPRKAKR